MLRNNSEQQNAAQPTAAERFKAAKAAKEAALQQANNYNESGQNKLGLANRIIAERENQAIRAK